MLSFTEKTRIRTSLMEAAAKNGGTLFIKKDSREYAVFLDVCNLGMMSVVSYDPKGRTSLRDRSEFYGRLTRRGWRAVCRRHPEHKQAYNKMYPGRRVQALVAV